MLAVLLILIDDPDDKKMFEKIYRENIEDLKKYAYFFLKNAEDAEDAVQDVFFKIAKNFDNISSRLKNENEWRNYLFMSIKNKAFDLIKKNNHQTDIFESLKVEYSHTLNDSFPDTIESSENIQHIVYAIQSLNITYKYVLYQNLIMGLKPSEIAKIDGIKIATVNQRLLRGKAILREKLESGEKNDKS